MAIFTRPLEALGIVVFNVVLAEVVVQKNVKAARCSRQGVSYVHLILQVFGYEVN